jgi:phosphatidylserine/phosphatidylglycerophosphate/cardiolipin synthase-like enzyme
MNPQRKLLWEQAAILAALTTILADVALIAHASPPPQSATLLTQSPNRGATYGNIELLFSPNGGCQYRLQQLIAASKSSIRVTEYTTSNLGIAESLIGARMRGVDVQVVVDQNTALESGSTMPRLAAAGIPVWSDGAEKIQHQKIMIFDGQAAAVGSYNFSAPAETENAEVLLIISDTSLCTALQANWDHHRGHSATYIPPPPKQPPWTMSPTCPCPNGICPINPFHPPTQRRGLLRCPTPR